MTVNTNKLYQLPEAKPFYKTGNAMRHTTIYDICSDFTIQQQEFPNHGHIFNAEMSFLITHNVQWQFDLMFTALHSIKLLNIKPGKEYQDC